MKNPTVVSVAISAIFVIFTTSFCVGSKHAFGDRNADFIVKLCETKLIDDSDNDIPRDYTIIFKFLGTIFQPILFIEMDINKESTGEMVGSSGIQNYLYPGHELTDFDATIHIKNATHVTANITYYTFDLPQYRDGLAKASITYVSVKNSTPTKKPFAQNSIGKRRNGDELLYFETRNVTTINRFPSRVFEYSGSEYLTYVGFSFNSPTAVALINTTFVKEQEFQAIVYDMNSEHFVAYMSVYGLKNRKKPDDFMGLLYA